MFGVVVRGAGAVVHFSSVRRCYINEVLWFCSRQSGPTRSGPKESGRVFQFRTGPYLGSSRSNLENERAQ